MSQLFSALALFLRGSAAFLRLPTAAYSATLQALSSGVVLVDAGARTSFTGFMNGLLAQAIPTPAPEDNPTTVPQSLLRRCLHPSGVGQLVSRLCSLLVAKSGAVIQLPCPHKSCWSCVGEPLVFNNKRKVRLHTLREGAVKVRSRHAAGRDSARPPAPPR